MNTANLQLEGLLAAMAALTTTLREKGVLTHDEIDQCLTKAEEATATDRPHEISQSNIEAIRFPFRYLRAATKAGNPPPSFASIAAQVGMTKDD
jgi:hypothetical protein